MYSAYISIIEVGPDCSTSLEDNTRKDLTIDAWKLHQDRQPNTDKPVTQVIFLVHSQPTLKFRSVEGDSAWSPAFPWYNNGLQTQD
ncbi:hypothetical protein RRG08_018950 [Elysia crispata]|uniref:Uncharacterized protein n=1 Tax=Elysia crispata TaxID=231223 RepID=A0AAE1A5I6_9GAST|nr:hypothetical protein RRG08_018950 [Elysia crispata]